MEFPNLGKHCAVEDCKLLDFLPFTCNGCSLTFCLDHRKYVSHHCSLAPVDVTVPQCPLCSQYIPASKTQDVNRVVEEHISKGCPPISSNNPNSRPHPCSQKGCKKGEFVPVSCRSCLKNFCFSHRLERDHTCIKPPTQKMNILNALNSRHPNTNTNTAITNRIVPTSTNKKKPIPSESVLKQKAKGNTNIPESKRFYLEVVYPTNSQIQPKLMFFNEEWSIGKVLDVIADAGGIINNNNKPGAEKLCLLSKSGEVLPSSVPLNSLTPKVSAFDSILLDRIAVN
eukprot:TRINITY_DN9254_c0_g1_i1.p1 TRINITY_DN9254_c0_g1~~TRINITY_DN9254_c0_g1_i1.p1  ORF type:complete len:301 (-),score=20.39 TRINITY_DN9254_c0_g1_i1:58-909(-)